MTVTKRVSFERLKKYFIKNITAGEFTERMETLCVEMLVKQTLCDIRPAVYIFWKFSGNEIHQWLQHFIVLLVPGVCFCLLDLFTCVYCVNVFILSGFFLLLSAFFSLQTRNFVLAPSALKCMLTGGGGSNISSYQLIFALLDFSPCAASAVRKSFEPFHISVSCRDTRFTDSST